MFLQRHQDLWLYRKSRKFFLHSNRKEYPIFPEQQLKLKMTEQDTQTGWLCCEKFPFWFLNYWKTSSKYMWTEKKWLCLYTVVFQLLKWRKCLKKFSPPLWFLLWQGPNPSTGGPASLKQHWGLMICPGGKKNKQPHSNIKNIALATGSLEYRKRPAIRAPFRQQSLGRQLS